MRLAGSYEAAYCAARHKVLTDVPPWYQAIGTLLLEQEPDTAFADELRDSFETVDGDDAC